MSIIYKPTDFYGGLSDHTYLKQFLVGIYVSSIVIIFYLRHWCKMLLKYSEVTTHQESSMFLPHELLYCFTNKLNISFINACLILLKFKFYLLRNSYASYPSAFTVNSNLISLVKIFSSTFVRCLSDTTLLQFSFFFS